MRNDAWLTVLAPFVLAIALVGAAVFVAVPVDARTRVGIGLSFGSGGSSGWGRFGRCPLLEADDLEEYVSRMIKERDRAFAEAEKKGEFLRTAPMTGFPAWSRCQEIALTTRSDMQLVRMHMAALRAALAMLNGRRDHGFGDSLGRDLPAGFDAEDWGESILGRLRACRANREHVVRIINRQADAVRYLFGETRSAIERDVVADYHAWERARLDPKNPQAANRAAWKLWHTMGCPQAR